MEIKEVDFTKLMKPAPKNGGFKMDGYWVWCGSVIKGEDNKYHMFAARWKHTLLMHPSWLTDSEIVRAISDTPEGPYEFEEVVLPARGAKYWDGRSTHNPVITKYKDTYILYYVGMTHPFLNLEDSEKLDIADPRVIVSRTNKRIGMATSKSILGPWERSDKPILETRPECFDSLLISNPTVAIDKNGKVTLIYKSRGYLDQPQDGFLHGPMKISVATAEKFDGVYTQVRETPIFADTYNGEDLIIEDPFIWQTEGGFHMIAKDMIGNLCGQVNGGMYAFSTDGLDWEISYGQKSYSREIVWEDGSKQTMGSLERPFILFEEGKPTHMFFATADGPGGFDQATQTWNMVIPLMIE